MSKEIEIKFRVDDVRALARRLRVAGFRQVTRRTHESNTLYDLPGLKLRKRGELLRLRKYGASWLLTHKAKGKVARHKTRIETETRIDCRIHHTAYEMNLNPRSGSNRSAAFTRPTLPSLMLPARPQNPT